MDALDVDDMYCFAGAPGNLIVLDSGADRQVYFELTLSCLGQRMDALDVVDTHCFAEATDNLVVLVSAAGRLVWLVDTQCDFARSAALDSELYWLAESAVAPETQVLAAVLDNGQS